VLLFFEIISIFEGNVLYKSITEKHLARKLESIYQNIRHTLGLHMKQWR